MEERVPTPEEGGGGIPLAALRSAMVGRDGKGSAPTGGEVLIASKSTAPAAAEVESVMAPSFRVRPRGGRRSGSVVFSGAILGGWELRIED